MIQQQKYGKTLLQTPAKIAAEYGSWTGLFRGLSMSCGREGVFTAGMLGVGPRSVVNPKSRSEWEHVRDALNSWHQLEPVRLYLLG